MKLAHTLAMTAVAVAALALGAIAAQPTLAWPMSEKTVMVGGAAMYPSKNIIDNAMKSKDQTTLVAAVKAAAVGKMIEDDGGKHAIKTVSGGTLVAMMKDDKIVLHDENEGTATVTIADVKQSNGVIHIIDRVLLPK